MAVPDAHTALDLAFALRVDEIVSHGHSPQKLPAMIRPDLLIGSISEAQDFAELSRLGCTHVLNMAHGVCHVECGERFTYLGIDADDSPSYDLLGEHFDAAYVFYRECRETGGRLFIHCMAGINRSGAMAIAFLVADGMDLLSAARHVHRVRGPVCWNKGFQLQLVRHARTRGLLVESEPSCRDEGG